MMVCSRCGRHEDDEYIFEEGRVTGESVKCRCGGIYLPAIRCGICGEWFDATKVENDECPVCPCCISDKSVLAVALEYAKEIDGSVMSLLEFVFSNAAEDALIDLIEQNPEKYDDKIRDFCADDLSAFCEYLYRKEVL